MFTKNKKAQVSDTIPWVVATLIIVVVLTISVFFTKNISNEKEISLSDKEKDFLATKSITNFLREPGNSGLIESVEDSQFRSKIYDFLSILKVKGSGDNPEGWILQIKGEEVNEKISYKPLLAQSVSQFGQVGATDFFKMRFKLNAKELNFWAECQEDKCR